MSVVNLEQGPPFPTQETSVINTECDYDPNLSAIEIAQHFQVNGNLIHEYPTYGVDRLLLSYREAFTQDCRPNSDEKPPILPAGLRELYRIRAKDLMDAQPELTDRYRQDPTVNPMYLIFEEWKRNYFDVRTYPATPEQEIEAFETLHDFSNDEKVKKINDQQALALTPNKTARILLWNTHLEKGLWGGFAETIIVPSSTVVCGDKGNCSILDLNNLSMEYSPHLMLSEVALKALIASGAIHSNERATRDSAAHLLS